MTLRIIATGSAVPEKIVTNCDLSRHMETTDEWIRTRTGIQQRRIAEGPEAEKLLRLAASASEAAIGMAEEERAGFSRQDIDLILAATCTPDLAFPATACRLQAALSIDQAAAFDISLACTGFLAALNTAAAFIKSGAYRNVLVVGADVMSRMIDWSDRNTAVLFGDGAGAVIVSAETGSCRISADSLETHGKAAASISETADAALPHFILRADGSGADALFCRAMYFNEAEPEREYMDGRRVFEFAVRKVPELIGELLSETGISADAVSSYILHQANYRIIEAVAKRLKLPIEKFPHNIEAYGNTTAASIPLLLDELNRSKKLKRGDLICLSGFGAGLSLGAGLLRW